MQPLAEPVAGEGDGVAAPVGAVGAVEPFAQGRFELAEIEEDVLRLAEGDRPAIEDAVGAAELLGVEQRAAVVALVAARPREAAVRADPLHVAVGQEPPLRLAVGAGHPVAVEIARFEEPQEDILGHGVVVLGVGLGEEIELDPQLVEGVQE